MVNTSLAMVFLMLVLPALVEALRIGKQLQGGDNVGRQPDESEALLDNNA
ncbi:hypothetical protein [Amycolatopsis oliviviridis]|nr:hypothetical protein [Amycolatopsis oliviviridis]